MSDDAVGPQRATPKTCRQIEAQTKQVKAELATEPRRPESFPQCPDTGLRFSTSSYEPAGPWFVEDASCLRVCTCTRVGGGVFATLAVCEDPFPDLGKLLSACEKLRRQMAGTMPQTDGPIAFRNVAGLAKAWGLEV